MNVEELIDRRIRQIMNVYTKYELARAMARQEYEDYEGGEE